MHIQLRTLFCGLLASGALLLTTTAASPAGEDCEIGYDFTGNGIDDGCEVSAGATDCNGNNVPDEWELTNPPVKYQLDNGELEAFYGYGFFWGGSFTPSQIVWWNQFQVQPKGTVVTEIVASVGIAHGATVRFIVWGDPDGDGVNNDGDIRALAGPYLLDDLLESASVGASLHSIPIPPTYIGEVGDSFFVGVHVTYSAFLGFMIGIDDSEDRPGPSWYAPNGSYESPATNEFVIHHTHGHMMVRALTPGGTDVNQNDVLDICEDCDWNGVPDDIDVATTPEIDCDGNGVLDVCQPRGNSFQVTTPVFEFPPLDFEWKDLPPPASDFVFVRIRFAGEVMPPVTLNLEGHELSFSGIATDTCTQQVSDVTVVPVETILPLIEDGTLTGSVTTTARQQKSECPNGNAMFLYLQYDASVPGDLNGNGQLDACEPPPPPPIPPVPDISGNGHIDMQDVVLLLDDWGCSTSPCPPWCDADLNADCTVDVFDLLVLLASWE